MNSPPPNPHPHKTTYSLIIPQYNLVDQGAIVSALQELTELTTGGCCQNPVRITWYVGLLGAIALFG